MAEVTNRTMEQLLRLHAQDSDWVSWLPYIEFIINTTPQSRTGVTPYEIVHGRKALFPVDIAVLPKDVPAAELFVRDLHSTWLKIRERLLQTSDRDIVHADRARRAADITVGDKVLLSTANLRLKYASDKLRPRFIGPFSVLQQVGKNAFKLDLPEHYQLHPVINVGKMRKYFGARMVPAAVDLEDGEHFEVERILTHRETPRQREYLVRWAGYDASEDMFVPE